MQSQSRSRKSQTQLIAQGAIRSADEHAGFDSKHAVVLRICDHRQSIRKPELMLQAIPCLYILLCIEVTQRKCSGLALAGGCRQTSQQTPHRCAALP